MTEATRIPLYQRLPEIYRIRDAEQLPPGQLAAFLGAPEEVFSALHENIEALYNDFFIDSCDDWVIPYIADLLGTSHLKGDAATLRADVAETIPLRRAKGSLSAIERLAANLTGWPCRAVEQFPLTAWAQHLNHQRFDAGGAAPWGGPEITRFTPRNGGTAPIRDPAMLSLVGSAFDPLAYTPDVKRADDGARHVNLPNLAVHLWRLQDYRLAVTRPLLKGVGSYGAPPAGSDRARYVLRFDLDPLDRPVRLFNSYERPAADPETGQIPLTAPDAVGAPILPGRLEETSEAGNPWAYVSVDVFTDDGSGPEGLDLGDVGLQLYHLDRPSLSNTQWRIRSGNLCAWEGGLPFEVAAGEIVVDPEIGRVAIGLATEAQRNAFVTTPMASAEPLCYFGYTYGAVGPIGAHPISRDHAAADGVTLRRVNALDPAAPSLQDAMEDLHLATGPVIIEIADSMVHDLDPATLSGAIAEAGLVAARLRFSLTIRAASGQRPVIRLAAPLAFRPLDVTAPEASGAGLRIEGVHLVNAVPGTPLIARAALAYVEIADATLDPGGWARRDGTRAPIETAMRLANGYGFDAGEADDEELDFAPTPDVIITRSVTGPLLIDDGYTLTLRDSIVDAGEGPGDAPRPRPAIGAASGSLSHGAPLSIRASTILGRAFVREARGTGGIFAKTLDVWNHQTGCLKHSYFSGEGDHLPPHYACVFAPEAPLRFTSTEFGNMGYGQLARTTDFNITNRGPGDDAMGATGFLLEAHKWINLTVRLREFMPLGVRPLLLAMT